MTTLSRRLMIMTFTAATALILAGCLTRPPLVQQTFALETPTPAATAPAASRGVLSLSPVTVSPLFDGRLFVYRLGPDQYQTDPYAAFITSPAQALGISIAAHLRQAGVFQDVIEPGSRVAASTILEVQVTELYGDWRTRHEPAAVMALRMQWFNAEGGQQQPFLRKTYTQRVALTERSAVALAAGWNQALAEITKAAAADVAAAR